MFKERLHIWKGLLERSEEMRRSTPTYGELFRFYKSIVDEETLRIGAIDIVHRELDRTGWLISHTVLMCQMC